MIFVLGLLAITLLCLGVHFLTEDYDNVWGFIGIGSLCILVFISGVVLPLERAGVKSKMLEFYSVERSLETARENSDISEFELAAIQQEIVCTNRWLAKAQYWAVHPLTNWFWVQDVMDLEPIK